MAEAIKTDRPKEPILQVRNLKKYFRTPYGSLHAVDDVSFDINKGETLGLVGESGCGKSTIGRSIMRLIEPTAGSVLFEGTDIAAIPKKQLKPIRQDMQFIFQDPYSSINPRMTVGQSIAEPLIVNHIVRDKAALLKRVYHFMDIVGLAGRFYSAYPHELDGGRRQRIGIARALTLDPKLIICDEPVSALDVSIQAQILNLLQDLQEQLALTYIFVTHDMSVVKHISTQIAVMYLGQIVERCKADELFFSPMHPYTRALLSAIPRPSLEARNMRREILRGEITSPIEPKPGCRFASRCNYCAPECTQTPYELADMGGGHFVACCRAKKDDLPYMVAGYAR
ncbi:ATP-binding cassette domain-containing protein [Christensenellaceae bacterium OttesenSCG-928-M15]|nr:ATP-binding cassette domain-containing protein [Christensenellaceae bacterium OttesenSCG-928-M15]